MYPPATSMMIFNNYPGISSARLPQKSALPAEMYPPGYQYDDGEESVTQAAEQQRRHGIATIIEQWRFEIVPVLTI